MLSKLIIYFCYSLKTSSYYKQTKHFFYNLLENPDSRLKSYFDLFMITLVISSVFFLIYNVENQTNRIEESFQLFVMAVFIAEYLLRGWLYSDSHQIILDEYEKSEYLNISFSLLKALGLVITKKLQYVFSFFAIIDLLAILPSYRPLRILRILLIFRLFKLFRYSNSLKVFSEVLASKRFELITLIIFMGFLVFISSIAFYLFENKTSGGEIQTLHDAFYWSIVTISTVGYGDITPQTLGGRLVTISLILTGLGVLSFFTSILVAAFNEKLHDLRENRTQAELSQFTNHIIICGFGRVGQDIAERLGNDKQPFIIIDKEKHNIYIAKQKKYLCLLGDASKNAVLINAGINQGATSILCTTNDDVDNVYITLTSRYLNPNINIVSRANREDNVNKLYQAGANSVIQPFEMAGLLAAEYAGQPVAFEAILGIVQGQKQIHMDTLVVQPDSILENKTIGSIDFENRKLTFVGVISSNKIIRKHHHQYKVKNQHFYFNPSANFVLQTHDIIVVLGRDLSIEYFQDQIEKSKLAIFK